MSKKWTLSVLFLLLSILQCPLFSTPVLFFPTNRVAKQWLLFCGKQWLLSSVIVVFALFLWNEDTVAFVVACFCCETWASDWKVGLSQCFVLLGLFRFVLLWEWINLLFVLYVIVVFVLCLYFRMTMFFFKNTCFFFSFLEDNLELLFLFYFLVDFLTNLQFIILFCFEPFITK